MTERGAAAQTGVRPREDAAAVIGHRVREVE